MGKSVFISTAIPYVNAAPHIGHAVEFVQADIIARYHRDVLKDDTFFLSGTDDNALKNVLKAEEEGTDIRTYVARSGDVFQRLLRDLNVSNTDFIRTSSDPRHIPGAQKLWRSFKKEDVVEKKYRGLYCVGCEEFKTDRDLVNGRCPEHPNAQLQEVEEKNYFFKLSNYGNTLKKLITSDTLHITPESRKNEALAFIEGGLEDISISRSTERAHGWGVEVPGDSSQVMYVWVDALSNYITALDYANDGSNFKRYWAGESERIHVIGKGISRFHAIYWPAFLLSAGIPLPTQLFVHGYLTVGGEKMSKSLGNVVDPFSIIQTYGSEAFRYYVSRHVNTFEDSDFTEEKFKEAYNADLANGLGNLAARVMQLAHINLSEPVKVEFVPYPAEFTHALEEYEMNKAVDYIWERIQALDQRINQTVPFKVVKIDLEKGRRLIQEMVRELAAIDQMLEPIMPSTSKSIIEAIMANKKPENLFPRKEEARSSSGRVPHFALPKKKKKKKGDLNFS